MLTCGKAQIFTVRELVMNRYELLGDFIWNESLWLYLHYWHQPDAGVYAVSFSHSAACYTNTQPSELPQMKQTDVAVACEESEVPNDHCVTLAAVHHRQTGE